MSVIFDSEKKIFKLDTLDSSYVFEIYQENYLVHLYYGKKIPDYNLKDFCDRRMFASFSASNPHMDDWVFSADVFPLEIGCNGCGDMRISSLQIRNADGNAATDMRYASHKIYSGKPALKGLPALYENEEGECTTLEITTRDIVTGAEAILLYTVFEKYSAITRSVIIRNTSDKPFTIEKVMSFNEFKQFIDEKAF